MLDLKGIEMATTCTRCDGIGFLNLDQIDPDVCDSSDGESILKWMAAHDDHDVSVCDCCGNGEDAWYGYPGEHYNTEDPIGNTGPYAYNGGLCECH
jgi:hypothetical protein